MTNKLTWFGHAVLGLETGGQHLIVDPFFTGNPAATAKAEQVNPNYILITHGHGDHVGDAVSIAKRSGAARFIDLYYFPPDGLETVLFTYRAGDAAPSAKSKGERRWPRPKATPNMQRATPNV